MASLKIDKDKYSDPPPWIEVTYVPVEGQTTKIAEKGIGLRIRFVGEALYSLEEITVWQVTIESDDGGHRNMDAVLKVAHPHTMPNYLAPDSLRSATKLSVNIWKVWQQAKLNEDARKGVLSADDTAIVQFPANILPFKSDSLVPKRVGTTILSGVLMRRQGESLVPSDSKYPKLSDQEVIRLLKTMTPVLHAFSSAGLVHCDIKEKNINRHPTDPNQFVLIDYGDVTPVGQLYQPLSTDLIPRSWPRPSLHIAPIVRATTSIDSLMLFFTCVRLLYGSESTKTFKEIRGALEPNLKNPELRALLFDPFRETAIVGQKATKELDIDIEKDLDNRLLTAMPPRSSYEDDKAILKIISTVGEFLLPHPPNNAHALIFKQQTKDNTFLCTFPPSNVEQSFTRDELRDLAQLLFENKTQQVNSRFGLRTGDIVSCLKQTRVVSSLNYDFGQYGLPESDASAFTPTNVGKWIIEKILVTAAP